jgi:LuxR family maltose regulon positive regulatory protein
LAVRLMTGLVSIHYEMAEVSALQAIATTLLQVATHAGFPASMAWAQTALGWANYLKNELAAAERHFKDLVSIVHSAHSRAMINSYTGLMLTALAQGRPHEALATIAALRELLLERGLLAYVPITDSLQQRVALVCEPSSALNWPHHGPIAPVPFEFVEQPALTQVRTLLARGAPADLAQAAELLAGRRAEETARFNLRGLIEVGALEALVCAGQENETAALAALQEAVERAAPGGALRLLVDCGPGLIGLLQKLQAAGVAPDYIRRVLAVYGSSAAAAGAPAASPETTWSAVRPDFLVEALTNREIDVLILLAERLTDKEIAERLVLSPGTVRKHTTHIYGKLGVDNRRAAVAQARRLGLI